MADNYLERKFEEYKEHKNVKSGSKRVVTYAKKPGYIQVKFPERRVFVTGGAKGIGKAIVTAFRSAGCKVAFCDIDARAGQATAEQTGSRFYPVDVKNTKELYACCKDIFKQWGDIDILINNVGISYFKPITEMTVEDFDQVIATNLRPVFITSKLLAEHRRENGNFEYGRIINLCSTRYLMSESGTEAYSASKGGIYSLTHALAASLSEMRITVNCISPGWIECGDYESLTERDHSQHLSRRVGRPEDVARICMFICEEDNNFINGENIVVDGGMTKKMIYV